MSKEYTIKVISYPSPVDGYEDGIIEVMRDSDGIDRSIRFLGPCGKCKIYLPLGEDNNEGGSSSPRELHWIEKDKILSITPSILVKGGCNEHFHITRNKVV
jgi:hypothetical protein